jgi:hypothetical protein
MSAQMKGTTNDTEQKTQHTWTVVFALTSLVLLLFHAVSTVKITAAAPSFVTFSSKTSDAFRSLFRYIYILASFSCVSTDT